MTRIAKTLGLVVLSALAIVASSAAGAHAAPLFVADEYTATIDGSAIEAPHVFTFGGIYQFECKKTPFQGKLSGPASSLTLTPTYEDCTWWWPVTEPPQPLSAVQVTMNGCDYRLSSLEFKAKDEYLAHANLECEAGKEVVIELHSGTPTICTLTVPAQSGLSDVKLIDETGKEGTGDDDVRAEITLGGLFYNLDPAVGCPVKKGEYKDLEYEGIATLTGTGKEGKQIGLRVSGE